MPCFILLVRLVFILKILIFIQLSSVYGLFPPKFPDVDSTLKQLPNNKCKEHVNNYFISLRNSTLWSVQSKHKE